MSIYASFARKILHPVDSFRIGQWAQIRYEREFQRTQFLPPDELNAIRLKRLKKVLQTAFDNCPFYRKRFEENGLVPDDIRTFEELSKLPILEKVHLQNSRDEMVSRIWPKNDLTLDQTGGSTGRPTSYFLSRDRICSRFAAAVRHDSWASCNIGDKVALIWGASPDLPVDSLKHRLKNALLTRKLWIDTGNVSQEILRGINTQLKSFRPKTILAYSSSLVLLARYLNSRNEQAYQPRSIISSAEVLAPDDRAMVENCFGCRVFDRYGSREFSVIASECSEHAGMHTMAEGLHIEIVRGDRAARAGELGEILVTDLLNTAMPMIRYRIGDMAEYVTEPCPCGRTLPRIQNIAGRVTDFVVGANGKLVSGVYLATYVVSKRPKLGQVQIQQNRPGEILFRIAIHEQGTPSQEDLNFLKTETENCLGQGTVVDIEFTDSIPKSPTGKTHFCKSSVGFDFD